MEKETVTIKDVEHVMMLSRLECEENEKEVIKDNLNAIVNYFGLLNEVNTSGVEAVSKPVGLLRDDEVKPSMDKFDVVKNAPFHTDSAFIVPKVVE